MASATTDVDTQLDAQFAHMQECAQLIARLLYDHPDHRHRFKYNAKFTHIFGILSRALLYDPEDDDPDGDDITEVMVQAQCSAEDAVKALEKSEGNIVNAVMTLEEDEVALVMRQTECSREKAIETLEKCQGNLVDAILLLTA